MTAENGTDWLILAFDAVVIALTATALFAGISIIEAGTAPLESAAVAGSVVGVGFFVAAVGEQIPARTPR